MGTTKPVSGGACRTDSVAMECRVLISKLDEKTLSPVERVGYESLRRDLDSAFARLLGESGRGSTPASDNSECTVGDLFALAVRKHSAAYGRAVANGDWRSAYLTVHVTWIPSYFQVAFFAAKKFFNLESGSPPNFMKSNVIEFPSIY